jgi:hypothetical protein
MYTVHTCEFSHLLQNISVAPRYWKRKQSLHPHRTQLFRSLRLSVIVPVLVLLALRELGDLECAVHTLVACHHFWCGPNTLALLACHTAEFCLVVRRSTKKRPRLGASSRRDQSRRNGPFIKPDCDWPEREFCQTTRHTRQGSSIHRHDMMHTPGERGEGAPTSHSLPHSLTHTH